MLLALQNHKPPKKTRKIPKPFTRILVVIGDSSESFAVRDLRRLEYFDSLFSDRWLANARLQQTPIVDVFGKSNNNPAFDCSDLKLVIESCKIDNIPFDANLSLEQIDSYSYCLDFFTKTDKQELIKYLVQYFANCTPSIDAEARQLWLLNAKHPAFREACFQYNNMLSQKKSVVEHDVMSGRNANLRASLFQYDADTAALLFRNKFKISIETFIDANSRQEQMRLKIDNFDMQECQKLLDRFNIENYWQYFGNGISDIVEKLENCHHIVHASENEYEVLLCILYQLIKALGNTDLDFECNIPDNVTVVSLIKSVINLLHRSQRAACFSKKGMDMFWEWCEDMNQSDTEEIVSVMLKLYPEYKRDASDETLWWELVKKLLDNCRTSFLVCNVKQWFPIMHQSKVLDIESSVEWVFECAIEYFTTQESFDFALYLARYAVFEHKGKNGSAQSNFPKKYLDFMKKEAGITWDIGAVSEKK